MEVSWLLSSGRMGNSGTCADRFVPPSVSDPAQLLELPAFAATKRGAVTTCHHDHIGGLERSPGNVPRPNQSHTVSGKRATCLRASHEGAQPSRTRGAASLRQRGRPRLARVEHRGPVAGKGCADALTERAQQLCHRARLGDKHCCAEGIAIGIRYAVHEVAEILHLHTGKPRKGLGHVIRTRAVGKLDGQLVDGSGSVPLKDVDPYEVATEVSDLAGDLTERSGAICQPYPDDHTVSHGVTVRNRCERRISATRTPGKLELRILVAHSPAAQFARSLAAWVEGPSRRRLDSPTAIVGQCCVSVGRRRFAP